MIRWPNRRRCLRAIMAAGILCMTLTGCPPRKPTPTVTPPGGAVTQTTTADPRGENQ
jgi:hypothetical protein